MAKVKFKKGKKTTKKPRSKTKSSKAKKEKKITRIKSVKRIKRIDKGTGLILGSFVVLLLIFGLIFSIRYAINSDRANTYNGFVVKKGSDDLWHLKVIKGSAELDVPLHYHPSELENITVWGNPNSFFQLLDQYGLNGAYVTFNPAQPVESFSYIALAASKISLNLKQAFSIDPIAACVAKMEGVCMERPIADCSTDDRMVIYLEDSPVNRTEVLEEVNCITVRGHGWDLIRATEKLLYTWYGVI